MDFMVFWLPFNIDPILMYCVSVGNWIRNGCGNKDHLNAKFVIVFNYEFNISTYNIIFLVLQTGRAIHFFFVPYNLQFLH